MSSNGPFNDHYDPGQTLPTPPTSAAVFLSRVESESRSIRATAPKPIPRKHRFWKTPEYHRRWEREVVGPRTLEQINRDRLKSRATNKMKEVEEKKKAKDAREKRFCMEKGIKMEDVEVTVIKKELREIEKGYSARMQDALRAARLRMYGNALETGAAVKQEKGGSEEKMEESKEMEEPKETVKEEPVAESEI